ncbi:MAG: hypothetical protein K2X48_14030 [Chitinophagaceae bacterium]|nr:hypothetical protein [Chitinophagaceae bacterium]
MHLYLSQLLTDLADATSNISSPFIEQELNLSDWKTNEEEEQTAPIRNLQEYTGITQEMLPPVHLLNEAQVNTLLEALKKLLDAHNWHFVLQTEVPEDIQYETIRNNWNQDIQLKQWHTGFFELCKPGAAHYTCALGSYCHCALFAEMFAGMSDEELSPEEERARALAIEVQHIQRKYGNDWMKYYPYHLDKNYDDENGNPYNYGFNREDHDDEEDDWWRK